MFNNSSKVDYEELVRKFSKSTKGMQEKYKRFYECMIGSYQFQHSDFQTPLSEVCAEWPISIRDETESNDDNEIIKIRKMNSKETVKNTLHNEPSNSFNEPSNSFKVTLSITEKSDEEEEYDDKNISKDENYEQQLSKLKPSSEKNVFSRHNQNIKKRANYSPEIKKILDDFFIENIYNPYPGKVDIKKLSERTGLTDKQIRVYMTNARMRKITPNGRIHKNKRTRISKVVTEDDK